MLLSYFIHLHGSKCKILFFNIFFAEKARILMAEKRHYEASFLLHAIYHLQEGRGKIATIGKTVRCYINTGQVDAARKLIAKAEQFLDSDEILDMLNMVTLEACDKEIGAIVAFLRESDMLDDAVSLNFARAHLALKCASSRKLEILGSIAFVMQSIAKHQTEHNTRCKFRFRYCAIFDKLLDDMENTRSVSKEDKMRKIVQVKKNYACCCNQMEDFEKSVQIHLEAIQTLKNVFGQYAKHQKLLGYCYSNLGTAYEGLGQRDNAKRLYLKGQKIYSLADDWESVEDKNFSLYLVQKKLERLL